MGIGDYLEGMGMLEAFSGGQGGIEGRGIAQKCQKGVEADVM